MARITYLAPHGRTARAVCQCRTTVGAGEKVKRNRTVVMIISLRVVTWCCVLGLAILSLLPAQDMVGTGFPRRVEHFIAYAGPAGIAMAGYGATQGARQIIGGFLGIRRRS